MGYASKATGAALRVLMTKLTGNPTNPLGTVDLTGALRAMEPFQEGASEQVIRHGLWAAVQYGRTGTCNNMPTEKAVARKGGWYRAVDDQGNPR